MSKKLTNMEKLYVILHKDRVKRICVKGYCGDKCPFHRNTLCNSLFGGVSTVKEPEFAKFLDEWQP